MQLVFCRSVVVLRVERRHANGLVLGDAHTATAICVEVLEASGLNGLGVVDRHDGVGRDEEWIWQTLAGSSVEFIPLARKQYDFRKR
jgi:hypothetical protein